MLESEGVLFNMGKKKTTEEFIAKARAIHGDKYDYSKVEYIGNKLKVCIICPIHGEFEQSPISHIKGSGCRACSYEKRLHNLWLIHKRNYLKRLAINPPIIKEKRKVLGVGINDMRGQCGMKETKKAWYAMLNRCYNPLSNRAAAYKNCSVCDEWLTFSNFKRWFDEHHVEGYELDKDILVKGNRVYGPGTCCFVPPRINILLINRRNHRGDLPLGVSHNNRRFASQYSRYGENVHLGTFDTPEEAFQTYKIAKEAYIKEVAQGSYDKGEITEKVYQALMNWQIDITD